MKIVMINYCELGFEHEPVIRKNNEKFEAFLNGEKIGEHKNLRLVKQLFNMRKTNNKRAFWSGGAYGS